MRLPLAVAAFATFALQPTAPLQAQGPAHAAAQSAHLGQASTGQAGRAFWGIGVPTLPAPQTASLPYVSLPAEPLPSDVELAYYHGARLPRHEPAWKSPPVGGNRHEAFSPEWMGSPERIGPPEWIGSQEGMGEDLALPAPIVAPVRTAPFPYGYFGASGTRHWQRHFGFRQAYTQWTLK